MDRFDVAGRLQARHSSINLLGDSVWRPFLQFDPTRIYWAVATYLGAGSICIVPGRPQSGWPANFTAGLTAQGLVNWEFSGAVVFMDWWIADTGGTPSVIDVTEVTLKEAVCGNTSSPYPTKLDLRPIELAQLLRDKRPAGLIDNTLLGITDDN
jgi:hypothetical protein